MPDDADPRVAALYDDVKAVLHVPFVNYLFRVLANDADPLAEGAPGAEPLTFPE